MLALPIQQESRFDPTEVLRRAHTRRLRIIPRYWANWSGAADDLALMEDRVIVRALLIVEKDSAPEDRPHRRSRFLCAFDLLERDGCDLRYGPIMWFLASCSPNWLEVKNPAAPAVRREREEAWGG